MKIFCPVFIRPAFCLFTGICFIAALGMLMVNLNYKTPAKNQFKDLGSVLKNIQLDALLIVSLLFGMILHLSWNTDRNDNFSFLLLLGTINSFCASYLFLFLQNVGGTRALIWGYLTHFSL